MNKNFLDIEKIYQLIKEKNLSVNSLAKLIHITPKTLKKYLSGNNNKMRVSVYIELCDVFNVKLSFFTIKKQKKTEL